MIRRRVIVVVAIAVLIFTSTVSVLVGLKDAPEAFAAGEGYVVSSEGSPTIFSSRVEMAMADILDQVDVVIGISPEVFAFSSWSGESFVVRGVELDRLESVGPSLNIDYFTEPVSSSLGFALLGSRLAERLGIENACVIPLVGSYSPGIELVRVQGTFASDSPLDDELICSLDVARSLSGMPSDKASIIRVATSDPGLLADLLSPREARLTAYDLSVSKSLVATGETFSVDVAVRNWGGSPGSAILRLCDDGTPFVEEEVTVNASSSRTMSFELVASSLGAHNISASIAGGLDVVIHAQVEVVEPYLIATCPSSVMLGSEIHVFVSDYIGVPAAGVTVGLTELSGLSNATDASGTCTLSPDVIGVYSFSFETEGTEFEGMTIRSSSSTVAVLDPGSYPAEFLPEIVSFSLSPESIKEGSEVSGTATVQNAGSLPGMFEIVITVDSQPHDSIEIPLGPAEAKTIRFVLDGIAPGTHFVQVGDFSVELEVIPWYADNPDLVELVVRYGGTSTLSSSNSLPIYQAAKISEGNISLALFALGTVAALLVTLAIVSVFAKEISEGRKRLGILRSIGASRGHIRRIVFPQALMAGLVGASVGVLLGLLVASFLVSSGSVLVFGHVLAFEISVGPVMIILTGAVAMSVVSALISAELAARETAISAIRGLPPEEVPELSLEELLGED